jgi:hypothetical protein
VHRRLDRTQSRSFGHNSNYSFRKIKTNINILLKMWWKVWNVVIVKITKSFATKYVVWVYILTDKFNRLPVYKTSNVAAASFSFVINFVSYTLIFRIFAQFTFIRQLLNFSFSLQVTRPFLEQHRSLHWVMAANVSRVCDGPCFKSRNIHWRIFRLLTVRLSCVLETSDTSHTVTQQQIPE